MRFEMSNLTSERDLSFQHHRTLQDFMASLVNGDPVPIPTPASMTDPISFAESRSKILDSALSSRKRPRKPVSLQAHPVLKRATRSSISTPPPIPILTGWFFFRIARSYYPARFRNRLARFKHEKPRQLHSAPPTSEDKGYTDVKDAALAALSGSRSSSHRKISGV